MVKNNFSYSVSVDCVIFGYDEDLLKILLIKRGVDPYVDYWALPGDLIHPNENTEEAVNRVLRDLTGLNDVFTEQVKTFGDIGRHPLGRVFTIAHYSLLKIKDYKLSPTNKENSPSSYALEAKWHNVNRIGELAFDHNKIFAACKEKLINNVKSKPVGFELLPDKFTLSELQNLYESILEKKFDKRNFRRRILEMDFLREVKKVQRNSRGRKAILYEFDPKKYNNYSKTGF